MDSVGLEMEIVTECEEGTHLLFLEYTIMT